MISQLYVKVFDGNTYLGEDHIQDFLKFVLRDVYALAVDERTITNDEYVFSLINDTVQHGTYDEILTLIEALVQYGDEYLCSSSHQYRYDKYMIDKAVNSVFMQEYIGYSVINNMIIPISNSDEADSIIDALSTEFDSVQKHLTKANRYLADRKKPDYENSIKESISAVEALCEKVTGTNRKEASLGKLLAKLEENGIIIHPCMKLAFDKLYGYTCDAKGIRHAGNLDGPNATFEEARFMLVSCSAFINYVTSLYAGGIKNESSKKGQIL